MERLADIADRPAPLSKVEAPHAATARLAMVLAQTRSRLKNRQKMPSWPRREEAPEIEEDLNDVEEDEATDSE